MAWKDDVRARTPTERFRALGEEVDHEYGTPAPTLLDFVSAYVPPRPALPRRAPTPDRPRLPGFSHGTPSAQKVARHTIAYLAHVHGLPLQLHLHLFTQQALSPDQARALRDKLCSLPPSALLLLCSLDGL